MIAEALRLHLLSLGVEGAENWTHGEIMKYTDEVLAEQAGESPQAFDATVSEILDNIKVNLAVVNEVLSEDLQS